MPNFICTTCGTQFAASDQPPAECKICTDERQFVGWNGQQWTTLDDLRESHRIVVRLEEAGLYGIGMEPSFDEFHNDSTSVAFSGHYFAAAEPEKRGDRTPRRLRGGIARIIGRI